MIQALKKRWYLSIQCFRRSYIMKDINLLLGEMIQTEFSYENKIIPNGNKNENLN